MKTYLFKTSTHVKPIDSNKWWIDKDLIPDMYIKATNLNKALKEYQQKIDDHGITISNHAIKNREPMFRDDENGNPIQIGYVITAKTLFYNNATGKWIDKYIDLWIEIQEVKNPFGKEEKIS